MVDHDQFYAMIMITINEFYTRRQIGKKE